MNVIDKAEIRIIFQERQGELVVPAVLGLYVNKLVEAVEEERQGLRRDVVWQAAHQARRHYFDVSSEKATMFQELIDRLNKGARVQEIVVGNPTP